MSNYNQLLINDYKQTIERIQKECTEKTDLNIKLISRIKELEQKLNAQFVEMEEKLTAEENKNFELKEEIKELRDLNRRLDNQREEYWKEYLKLDKKLKIAEEALQYYADGQDMGEAKLEGSDAWRYIVDDNHTDIAKQALKQMEEVNANI